MSTIRIFNAIDDGNYLKIIYLIIVMDYLYCSVMVYKSF